MAGSPLSISTRKDARGRRVYPGHLGRATQVDHEDVLVRAGQRGADADAAVVALQDHQLVVAQGDERGDAAALACAFQPVGILPHGLTHGGVVLDDAGVQTTAGAAP